MKVNRGVPSGNPLSSASPMEPLYGVSTKGFNRAQGYLRSRRLSSRSTASRTKSVRSSPSARTAPIRANVPSGNRACMFSAQSRGLPTGAGVSDTTFSAKRELFLISPIALQPHITYIGDIRYGGK